VLNEAAKQLEEGTRWPGMSYEEGVRAGIEWALGRICENPMEE
jgi:hypothetical protein